MRNKKIILLIIIIIVVLLIAGITCVLIIKQKNDNKKSTPIVEETPITINTEELEEDFPTIFTNEIIGTDEEIVEMVWDIQSNESGKYNIDIKIPNIKLDTKIAEEINTEIDNIFVDKTRNIVNETTQFTIFKTDYIAYVNENILSLAIKCTLKEGSNPQRIIMRTYSYDMENDKMLTLSEVLDIKEINVQGLESKILEKIESENKKVETLHDEGYNVYMRDLESDMYEIENTTEFFVNQDGILYVIYPYGNKNFTSEYDVIITN